MKGKRINNLGKKYNSKEFLFIGENKLFWKRIIKNIST